MRTSLRAVGATLVLLGVGACFGIPSLTGPYRCDENSACASGSACWDGLCCVPGGQPECVGYVYEGGLCADGGTSEVYSEDLDGDGYGGVGKTRAYCSAPVFDPYVLQGGDCDDNAETGSLSAPNLLEVCDGRDNDCDGLTDEKPECTGPSNLLTGSLERAARNTQTALNGRPSSCVKDLAGVSETFRVTGADWEWLGTGPYAHVAWVEAPPGMFWDLRTSAEMFATIDYTVTNPATPAWSPHFQPVILICGPKGFIRMVHTGGALLSTAAVGSMSLRLRMGDNLYGWEVGNNSSPDLEAVLGQVQRIEVLIQPAGVAPNFRLLFRDWGFY